MKYFDLKVGFTCNNNCIHCVITDKKSTPDLTTQEIRNIIDGIPSDTIVGFTGGEATIRPDFLEILKYAKTTGHETALQTNGTQFSDWDFAVDASKLLDHVLIAIHSHISEVHEAIVRMPGMYNNTINGFKNIIKLRIPCTTQTVISNLNINTLLETYDFIQSISPGIRMNLTYPHPNGNALINSDQVVLKFTNIKNQLQEILKKYSHLLNTEAIPICYLYPYQDQVYNLDENIKEISKSGLDPANKNVIFFDESGKTDDYSISQLSERRKGRLCLKCDFNSRCIGVWKEYSQIYKNNFDLFPIKSKEQIINDEWGALIIYGKSKCMNRCTFCSGTSPEMNEDEKYDLLIKEASYHINQGIKKIEISGGDPGEYDRLPEIIKYLSDNKVELIQLSTHGRTLKDESFVKLLKDSGLNKVKIPLYGSTAEIHNKTVQYEPRPGNAYEDTILGIKNCEKYDIEILGHTMINQYNKNDINNVIQLYLDLSNNKITDIYVGIAFIAHLTYEYTGNWFLPIKDMGPYIKEVYNNHPILPKNTNLLFLDIPYCVLGKFSNLFENKFMGFPNLGLHKVDDQLKSDISDKIPHYRIKSHFEECSRCCLRDKCGAIPLNELKMFGTYGLKALKEEACECLDLQI